MKIKATQLGKEKNGSENQRFIVRADEKLTAFAELESAIRLYRRNPRNLRFNDFSVSAKK